ncbi:MAG: hypothetical protein PHP44_11595 [Kiritimatiellae bacterium]|nr:hypothetical protein [Kiritimatiellia bacterium]
MTTGKGLSRQQGNADYGAQKQGESLKYRTDPFFLTPFFGFQWLEKPLRKFPMVGKTAQKVSNGLKNRSESFQWFEKPLRKFPRVGKTSPKVSKGWKNVSKSFQGLEKRLQKFPRVGKTPFAPNTAQMAHLRRYRAAAGLSAAGCRILHVMFAK